MDVVPSFDADTIGRISRNSLAIIAQFWQFVALSANN
jgi:hypothetical protein